MNEYKQDNVNMVLEDETLRSEGTISTTGEEQRTSTSSTKIYDVVGLKPNGRPDTDVLSAKIGVRCCKTSHTVGTWNMER